MLTLQDKPKLESLADKQYLKKLAELPQRGRIELVMGPMFAGKSTELLKIINYYRILEKNLFIINHKLDNRYGTNSIISHDKKSFPSNNCLTLMENIQTDTYHTCDVIIIEEAQFFEDLKVFVELSLMNNKTIYVAGLDGDSFMKPFGQILDLIPLCDSIKKLSALCVICKDGTPANFTKRIVENQEQKLIGSFESFIPVCRVHHKNT